MSQDLCRKLKEARAKLGLSQVQFAEKVRIPVRTIRKWEIDQATPDAFKLESLERKIEELLKEQQSASGPQSSPGS